jgi:hypothetical protein
VIPVPNPVRVVHLLALPEVVAVMVVVAHVHAELAKYAMEISV